MLGCFIRGKGTCGAKFGCCNKTLIGISGSTNLVCNTRFYKSIICVMWVQNYCLVYMQAVCDY